MGTRAALLATCAAAPAIQAGTHLGLVVTAALVLKAGRDAYDDIAVYR